VFGYRINRFTDRLYDLRRKILKDSRRNAAR
jgi:hypothetical protein